MTRRLQYLALFALFGVAGCTMAGGAGTEPEGPAPIRLATTDLSSREESSAARLFVSAREAFDAGDWSEAGAIAGEVIDDYPGSAVSGDALWLRARAFGRVEAGGLQAVAVEDLERLIPLLPETDRRLGPAVLLNARLLVEQGDVSEGLGMALSAPVEAVSDDALSWFRAGLERLDAGAAAALAFEVDGANPFAVPLLVGAARALRLDGSGEEAMALANRALQSGARGADLELATQIAQGQPLQEELERRVVMVAILPKSGSPSARGIADRIESGILAAVEASGLSELVDFQVLDDGGDLGAAASLVQAAERQGAIAIVGPLGAEALAQAAAARRSETVLLSPTAFEVPGAEGVYSLSAFDPTAASALADWAAAASLGDVAVIHPAFGPSADEARGFAERYSALGGRVSGLFSYEPGATYFEAQIDEALASRPQALLLPVPPEDVFALAPQVTFFGLDTLGVRILGTGGWTDPEVLLDVSSRHLNGVVTAAPARSEAGWDRLEVAYGRRFRQTLLDGSIEALGYDAASVLLAGVQQGARNPAALRRTLERLPAFEGATGDLSIREGGIRRAHDIICMHDGELLPTAASQVPVLQYRPYPPDPETDSVPEGPGRMAGYLCSQVAPPDTLVGAR